VGGVSDDDAVTLGGCISASSQWGPMYGHLLSFFHALQRYAVPRCGRGTAPSLPASVVMNLFDVLRAAARGPGALVHPSAPSEPKPFRPGPRLLSQAASGQREIQPCYVHTPFEMYDTLQ
jgi:hypothetical protein